jgi:hypothetical protein
MGVGEIIADVLGGIILAILVVAAVKFCLRAAGQAGEVIAECLGGDMPALPLTPDDVQELRDKGAL